MTPIEIIALIFIVIAIVKMVSVFINPKPGLNFAKKFTGSPMLLMIIDLIIGGVILYYLLQELTIIHIIAVMFFTVMLVKIAFMPFIGEMLSVTDKILKKGLVKKSWLYLLVWTVLLLWGLKELFMLTLF